ncbi:MAG: hypothetical protein IPL23_00005 [Saprospiraceae bacterium]|nr:hypothetical protein [Saprospiraceae bacterium]
MEWSNANGGDTLPGVYVMNVTYSFKDQVKTVVKTVTVVDSDETIDKGREKKVQMRQLSIF